MPAAVEQCRTAGIRVIMITGDYPQTARAIAAQANIEAGDIVIGSDLEKMSDAEIMRRVRTANVFARTMPEQKLRIVNALKANGEVVAMTGDGVNDAPSLKAAHIGIAMGGRGTDVAREAASLVLLDDDFTSIVTAIRLGRRIYDNLRKAMAYILAIHVPIAGLALIPLLFGLPWCSGRYTSPFSRWSSIPSAQSCSKPRVRNRTPCTVHHAIHRSRFLTPDLSPGAFCKEQSSWRSSRRCLLWLCAEGYRNRTLAPLPLPLWLRQILALCWSIAHWARRSSPRSGDRTPPYGGLSLRPAQFSPVSFSSCRRASCSTLGRCTPTILPWHCAAA